MRLFVLMLVACTLGDVMPQCTQHPCSRCTVLWLHADSLLAANCATVPPWQGLCCFKCSSSSAGIATVVAYLAAH